MAAAANAGRKAAPPKLKLISGRSEGKDSGGRDVAPEVPFTRAAPVKPAELSTDAVWLWDQVVAQMQSIGLLKPLDAASLEVMCETFSMWREAVRWRREHGLLAKSSQGTIAARWVQIENMASKDFRAWCSEYGITPAAEKNLVNQDGQNGGGDDNPF